mmetsp:Transcript_7026/g.9188  ORF Transcript_7026/g.9188 Transcript_7026/m.9188 type:complete len:279 (-) Transcript_7026:997-1833(-)
MTLQSDAAFYDTHPPREVESAIYVANCCNCLALVFFLFIFFTPFTVWTQGYQEGVYTRLGTGPFVASDVVDSFPCNPLYCEDFILDNRVFWGDITDSQSACSNVTNIYTDWSGRYGFCDRVDGEFEAIPEIKTIQAFNVMAFILVIVSTCFGFSVRFSRKHGAYIAGVFSFFAMVSCLVSFSIMATTGWYQDLRSSEGGFLPVFTTTGALVAIPAHSWSYGASFGLLITICIWNLFASVAYVVLGKFIEEELDMRTDRDPDFIGDEPDVKAHSTLNQT